MIYDAQAGRPFTPKFRIVDSFGSPITSGITGTMTVYGLTGAQIATGALTHQGDGFWGLSVAGSLLTSLGTYAWATGAISGTATLAAQGGTFIVGQGDLMTLREIYTDVRIALDDGYTGTTTGSGSTTSLVCARFAFGSNNRWKGSELYLFEPGNAADLNPVTVTSFTAATGTFTFAGQAITSTVAGQDFIIGNRQGRGWRHEQVLSAITRAVRRQRTPRRVWNQVALTTNSTQFEYQVPTGWLSVDTVEYRPPLRYNDYWQPMARGTFWKFQPDRGVLSLSLPQWNYPLRITGRALPSVPSGMTDLVQADGIQLGDDALYELLNGSEDIADQRRAASMAGPVMRGRMGSQLGRM